MAVTVAKDPDTYLTQVNTAVDDVTNAVNALIQRLSNFLTDHLEEIGGLAGGPLGWYIAHKMENRFHDACNALIKKWEDAQVELRHIIGSILGDPLMMSQIASDYRDAARVMGGLTNTVGDANSLLRSDWTGRAYNAYDGVSTDQKQAIMGVGVMLTDAAKLLDSNEQALINLWVSELQNLVNLVADLGKESGGFGDIGNAFTAEAGVAVGMISALLKDAASFVKTYADYWTNLNITSAGSWDGLNAQFGQRGLPGDRWPQPSAAQNGAMNDPWKTT